MAKLHEIIAVEPDLRAAAAQSLKNVTRTFGSPDRLVGQVRRYQPLEDGGDSQPNEDSVMASTVKEMLDQLTSDFGGYLDVTIQKEVSNTGTSANVVIDGKTLFGKVPATVLLNLENRLAELKAAYKVIPTLDPVVEWHFDEKQGCYTSAPRITYRTRKVLKNHVKVEATKEHPAQVDIFTEDVRIGEWKTVIQSGLIPLTEKRQIISRLEKLTRAVKSARQRANEAEASERTFADVLFGYIHKGTV